MEGYYSSINLFLLSYYSLSLVFPFLFSSLSLVLLTLYQNEPMVDYIKHSVAGRENPKPTTNRPVICLLAVDKDKTKQRREGTGGERGWLTWRFLLFIPTNLF